MDAFLRRRHQSEPGARERIHPRRIGPGTLLQLQLPPLFVEGALTSDQAAARASTAAPAVWRKLAELEIAVAELDAARLQRVPQLTAKLSYTRLSALDGSGALGLGLPTSPALDWHGLRDRAAEPAR